MFNIYEICRLCYFAALEFTQKRLVSFTRQCRYSIQVRWETLKLRCGKFILDNTYHILL